MGRPLNKKYFGNRNIGTTGDTDDKIGGEGIASINWSNLGLFRGNHATNEPLVGLDLPAPTLPGGVQATWTVTFEVASVSTGAGKAGLVVGDTYTYAAAGSPTITVATISGTNATFTTTAGSGLVYGSLPTDVTGVNITKVTGSGPATFLTDINFKVKSATINEKGSGYTGAETFTVTTYSATTGAAPAGTIVLTTDSGVTNGMNAADNQENAIIAYGYVGGARQVVDIIRQINGKSYKIQGASGIVQSAKLVTDANANAADEVDINAVDSGGGTYRLAKIAGRKATVIRSGSGPWEFASGASVPWTFTAAPAATALQTGYNVKIDNA